MRQRVVIALAIAAEPQLVVADEPTTALDVSIQAQIITLLKRLAAEHDTAVMLITHDMGVIAETADRVAVLYAGRLAEIGPVREVIHAPRHPYTRGLMSSIPKLGEGRERLAQIDGAMPRLNAIPPGCAFNPAAPSASRAAPWSVPRRFRPAATSLHAGCMTDRADESLLRVENAGRDFDVSRPWLNRVLEGEPRRSLRAVDGVSFSIRKGETLGLVGESGCGKSTVARMIVGLYPPSRGRIVFDGADLADPASAPLRRRMQMIFQDPYASLNPRWRVRAIVAEPIVAQGLVASKGDARRAGSRVAHAGGAFAGGRRQVPARILGRPAPAHLDCARAVLQPRVPGVRRADVRARRLGAGADPQPSMQQGPRRTSSAPYLFISHNLAVVAHIATRVGVMYLGRLVEIADAKQLFERPRHPYTRMLIDAIPDLQMTGKARIPVAGEVPNPLDPPAGCAFNPRCPHADERCRSERPALLTLASGGAAACHAVAEGRLGP